VRVVELLVIRPREVGTRLAPTGGGESWLRCLRRAGRGPRHDRHVWVSRMCSTCTRMSRAISR
jgi:hypothetical protein